MAPRTAGWEDILLEAHAQGRINATVLRLPDFYGPGVEASLLHGAAVAAVRRGTADMIGPIDKPHEFVYVPDVGPVLSFEVEPHAATTAVPSTRPEMGKKRMMLKDLGRVWGEHARSVEHSSDRSDSRVSLPAGVPRLRS